MDLNWVAVDACTLPTVEQPLRLAEFDALFAGRMTSIEASRDQRARMVFEGLVGLQAMVQDLADRESQCCSFFAFTVASVAGDHGSEAVTLDVEVPVSRAHVLAALVARATDLAGLGSV